jgi:multidrug resistance efflux pump
MEQRTAPTRGLPLDWKAMLDKVQEALTKAEVEARQREQSYPSADSGPSSGSDATWQAGFERLDHGLTAMQARLHEQDLKLGAVEVEVSAEQAALAQWLAAVKEVQRSLANWGSREV